MRVGAGLPANTAFANWLATTKTGFFTMIPDFGTSK